MPKSATPLDYRLEQAREALKKYLADNAMKLTTLAELAGVSQSQASKLIFGSRKRVSADLRKLCQYAGIELETSPPPWWANPSLGPAIQKAVGNSEQAQALLGRIVAAMTPALTSLSPGAVVPNRKKVNRER